MVEIQELEGKHPTEIVQYRFDLSKNQAFSDYSETVGSKAWYVYDEDDLATNLSGTMVAADGNGTDYVTVDIRSDTTGKTYRVVGVVTASSGRKYVVMGRFKSDNRGVAL